ncbi:amino acid ABC transporter substrate-binding protein [Limosilactobacillus sp. STM2_1]|uniref:Amino acid ABC transporter substrate-binding protein n=1 Tax=Limosilactobacillus rudii TaxID=2759755 RepID=A0A7W3YPE9_9LACO|nr:amino acid ABC transporter substrate-binding protein [Limosilactobacillus rudii]MBB1080435.1 amino acid ABC transporter substrate-binding protein [Limosilactobacillus rudii]MBB1098461.1 amino acid ABC transporter substrate-binding protein [Limosilactobacillus rudii]MCD7135469.1 amino acid ABC transporter substrate-binding protein [Limosilactobacillus rudii]
MKFWKKALLTIAALTVGTSAGISSIHAASVNSELKNKGELTIGLEGTYSPYSYRQNNKLTGFEVELGKAVAKKMGLKAKFVPTKWDSLIAGLGSGKYDVVMNNITQTPERAKQYNFSTPYIKSRFALIVPANSKIKNLNDIKGKKVVAGTGTNNADIAKKYGAKLVPNGDFASAVGMIKQGRAEAEINSREAWYSYRKKNNTKGLKMIDVSSEQKPAKISALFNKKDPAIQSSYNKAIKELQKDGTIKKLSEKYFGADITE